MFDDRRGIAFVVVAAVVEAAAAASSVLHSPSEVRRVLDTFAMKMNGNERTIYRYL